MKKQIFLVGVASFLAVSGVAQVKVTNGGRLYIGGNAQDSVAMLNVGNFSDNIGLGQDNKVGVFVRTDKSSACETVGIYGEATKGNPSIGVWGYGYDGTGNNMLISYGVLGTVGPSNKGAGISGTNEGCAPPPFSGTYGAYFYGDNYTDGDVITTTGFYNYSDMRLKDDVRLLSESGMDSELDNLQKLNVLEYTLKRPWQTRKDAAEAMPSRSDLDKSKDARRHFGLSAQELQRVYPELVQEGQEGFLMVNYSELVPILLRSIQELDGKVRELETALGTARTRSASRLDSDTEQSGTAAVATKARLYQNTPNPFTARTEIKFSLPEDATSAYIYIFDMTGKPLRQLPVTPQQHSVTIDGYELSAGMYLYSLVVAGKEIDTKRMILSK